MNGFHDSARQGRRRGGGGPPGCDRVIAALRGAARVFVIAGAAILAAGLTTLGAALLRPAGDAALLLCALGIFLIALSFLPLLLARRRLRRIRFLAVLRQRWENLARAGDPHEQIPALSRAYAGLVSNDLRLWVRA